MKRVRHVAFTAQQDDDQIREDEQQATPIFDLIAQALHKWDILCLAKYNNLAYEGVVIWLIQHLEPLSDRNDVERLIVQVFTEQQGSNQVDPEDVLRMKALADEIFRCWSVYQQRNETSALSKKTHTRSRMRRFLLPQ